MISLAFSAHLCQSSQQPSYKISFLRLESSFPVYTIEDIETKPNFHTTVSFSFQIPTLPCPSDHAHLYVWSLLGLHVLSLPLVPCPPPSLVPPGPLSSPSLVPESFPSLVPCPLPPWSPVLSLPAPECSPSLVPCPLPLWSPSLSVQPRLINVARGFSGRQPGEGNCFTSYFLGGKIVDPGEGALPGFLAGDGWIPVGHRMAWQGPNQGTPCSNFELCSMVRAMYCMQQGVLLKRSPGLHCSRVHHSCMVPGAWCSKMYNVPQLWSAINPNPKQRDHPGWICATGASFYFPALHFPN